MNDLLMTRHMLFAALATIGAVVQVTEGGTLSVATSGSTNHFFMTGLSDGVDSTRTSNMNVLSQPNWTLSSASVQETGGGLTGRDIVTVDFYLEHNAPNFQAGRPLWGYASVVAGDHTRDRVPHYTSYTQPHPDNLNHPDFDWLTTTIVAGSVGRHLDIRSYVFTALAKHHFVPRKQGGGSLGPIGGITDVDMEAGAARFGSVSWITGVTEGDISGPPTLSIAVSMNALSANNITSMGLRLGSLEGPVAETFSPSMANFEELAGFHATAQFQITPELAANIDNGGVFLAMTTTDGDLIGGRMDVVLVPEPGAIMMLGSCLIGVRRRREY